MDVREKLVELLDEAEEWADHKCDELDCETCYAGKMKGNCVQQLMVDRLIYHGVTVQEWISVKDRLPDVNTNKSGYESKGVIVLIEGCKKSAYRIYERACNRGKTVYRWKYPWDTISDEHITHWCELLKPPKGE